MFKKSQNQTWKARYRYFHIGNMHCLHHIFNKLKSTDITIYKWASSKWYAWSDIKKASWIFSKKTFNVFFYFHLNAQIETSTWYIQGLIVLFSL